MRRLDPADTPHYAMTSPPTIAAPRGHGFGTMPVFLAGISTILGAIMFLRFGYAVGNLGLLGSVGVILLGHMVTVPTALALAEIATNRKVEGGGEYFIISRSFGTTIGSVIGFSLYLSQAISVAFYMIAFAEAFWPLAPHIEAALGVPFDPRMVSIPGTVALLALMLTKGADMGVKALYVVVVTLVASLVMFFLGGQVDGHSPDRLMLLARVDSPDSFMVVFAICFPAFTGMTAGVGLSGDLANPKVSIPRGTMAATLVGMVVYLAIVVKLAWSAPPELLAGDQLAMSRIALWGPIIPIGLACATLSSAIGSILVAPRTLQALGGDASMPWGRFNGWISGGVGHANEPRNATVITGIVAVTIVAAGNVDFVAGIISMFFMVTYGALNAISFLEHFAARPSYRPSFRSRWYVSLFGAVICGFIMFQMDPLYALVAILFMVGLYHLIASRRDKAVDDLAAMFEGVMTQATRFMHIRTQLRRERSMDLEWRPSVIMVDGRTFDRRGQLDFMRWLCHRHGFGTYLHYMRGHLGAETFAQSRAVKHDLLQLNAAAGGTLNMDTIVSPSMISALAQSLQVPGISGLSNNTVVFELTVHDPPEVQKEVVDSCLFASSTQMALLVLRHGDHHFGDRKNIHIWLTWNDRNNANLMVLLGYILLGHPDWARGEISVFVALPTDEIEERRPEFMGMIEQGRIPISQNKIEVLEVNDRESFAAMVADRSGHADLTMIGFDVDALRERRESLLTNHPALRDVLFVHAPERISLD